eukprot:3563480-Rhodomonas_salina.1
MPSTELAYEGRRGAGGCVPRHPGHVTARWHQGLHPAGIPGVHAEAREWDAVALGLRIGTPYCHSLWWYVMCGTEIEYGAYVAVPTELAYAATRCPVLR